MPIRSLNQWVWPRVSEQGENSKDLVNFDFSEPSNIDEVVATFESLSGKKISFETKNRGRLAIYNANRVEISKVSFLFSTALHKLGLKLDGEKITNL